MRTLATAVVVLVLLAAAAVVVAYSGAVDVSALKSHSAPVEWFLVTARDRSIDARAEEIPVPPLDDPRAIAEGLVHYHSMCVTCHGAPGVEPSEVGKGLNPMPPDLTHEEFDEAETAEAFWVVQNGIRMTGMPAFGATHTDQELWHIVAFLRQLPGLSPDEYAARVAAAGMEMEGGGHRHGGEAAEGSHRHGEAGGAAPDAGVPGGETDDGEAEDAAGDDAGHHHDDDHPHDDHPH